MDQVATLASFGSVWAVLSVGHNLADHVIGQTDVGVSNWRPRRNATERAMPQGRSPGHRPHGNEKAA
jgi:hypothetical protein